MAFASRLLSRCKQLYAGQVILPYEHCIPVNCFAREVAPVGLPPVRGDDIGSPASGQKVPYSFATPLPHLRERINGKVDNKCHVCRCSTLSEAPQDRLVQEDFLTFIESIADEAEGQNHCWLNKNEENGVLFNKDGIFLVIVGALLLGQRDHIIMLERTKLLQQRFPELQVFGLQYGSSVNFVATQFLVIKTVMEEYITFPVLLLDKEFTEMTNEACYLLFEGYKGPLLHHKSNVELGVLVKELEEFNLMQKGKAFTIQDSNSSRISQTEVIKEPYVCSFRNLLLYYPGCVSADEYGNRLFLSDTNHHRIIVADGDGKIIDCIGSCPGLEDGEFESAKLMRPAASFYNATENCLYFADSENHAIRRADMERRVLETVYPVYDKKTSGLWSWILDKLGMGREADPKRAEFDWDSLIFPWHLMKSGENDLLVINRSIETSWTISMATGEIKRVLRGFPNIMEIYGQMIMKKASPLEEIFGIWLEQRIDPWFSLEGLSYAGLMSSVTNLHNNIIFCHTAGQRVLRCHRESRAIADIQFSDFEVLGLPYWLACPLEGVFASGDSYGGQATCHLLCYSVLPGRCDIRVNVDIPEGSELAAPLQEGCVWRQARGSAAEVSGSDMVATSSEKVGIAQQWFDELDNLAFSNPAMESGIKDKEKHPNINFQDENTVHIDCAVNISPGTSEVIISAVLYLKLRKACDFLQNQKNREAATRILDLCKKLEDDASIRLLLETCKDVRDVVFMKPVHLRIRLDCGDHPTSKGSKEVISTVSTLEVKVSLS